MGGKSTNTTATKLAGINIQTSTYGRAIPKVYGTARVSANLLYYTDFAAISHVTKTKTGGKGGGTNTNTTYSYTASVMLALASGPIAGVRKIYRDKAVYTNGAQTALQQAGLSLVTGNIGQAPWGYLTTNHPTEALGYSGLAYVYAANYPLSDNAQLTNHTFEVVSTIKDATRDDAAPADIIADSANALPLWKSGLWADLTDYRNYCKAAGIWLSVALEQSVTAREFYTKLLKATNSEAVWSGEQFKIIPYGDQTITKDGTTWVPNLTPIYDIDDSITIDQGDSPSIEYARPREADAYNYLQVDFSNRARDYADANTIAQEPAAIADYGLRKSDSLDFKNIICDPDVADAVANVLVCRMAVVRREFTLKLPSTYFLLEPMDLVTLTRAELGLNRELMRVVDVEEDDEGDLNVVVEEVLAGAATGAIVTRQGMGGFYPDYNVASGAASAPLLIQPPKQMTEGALEMWVATNGGANWGGAEIWVSLDNTTYERRGVINGPARYGVTTSALAVASDPQNGNLGVNIGTTGALDPATQAEFNAGVTLCMVDQEVIAYRDSTLTAQGQYTLGQLRRGLFGTTIATHAAGAPFARLDQAVTSLGFEQKDIGRTIYIKLRSYNKYGRNFEDLANCTAYPCILGQTGAAYVSTGSVAQIGTNVVFQDGTTPPQSRLDNTQQQWTEVNNRPTTLAALDSAANALVSGINTEVVNARNGAANLLTSVQNAATTANWTTITGRPTNLAGLDSVAAASVTQLVSQMNGLPTGSGAVLTALNTKIDTATANANFATAGSLTTLTSQVGGAFAVVQTNTPTQKTWTTDVYATQAAAADLSASLISSGAFSITGNSTEVGMKVILPISTNIYEVSTDIEIVNKGTGANPYIYINAMGFNDNESTNASPWAVTVDDWAGHIAGRYRLKYRFGKTAVAGTFSTSNGVISYSGVFAIGNPTTSNKVRFTVGWNNGTNVVGKVYSISITDVTTVAATEASITTLAATEAGHYSSLATLTTNLTAKTSSGSFQNPNAGFDIYTNATSFADNWSTWVATATAVRVTDGSGGYAMQLTSAANFSEGPFQQIPCIDISGSYLIFIAKVKPNTTGSLNGAGLYLYHPSGTHFYLPFATEPDAYGNVAGGGVAGQTYTFSKIYKTPISTTGNANFHLMQHWDGLGTITSANDITWYEAGYRFATQAEIQANKVINDPMGTGTTLSATIANEQIARANGDAALTTSISTLSTTVGGHTTTISTIQSNLTTLDGRVSLYYGMKLDGAGVTSFELMNGAGVPYGGIAKLTASKFLIYGDTIVSGTITGAAIAAGSITTDKLNIGGTTGARLAFVYNAIKVYDANNIVRIQIGDLAA